MLIAERQDPKELTKRERERGRGRGGERKREGWRERPVLSMVKK